MLPWTFDVRLGVDPRKANQMVRGVCLCQMVRVKLRGFFACVLQMLKLLLRKAGADYVGLDEYIEKIKGGWN